VSLRHSARLAHFARLIEEELEKKQRLEWYLQEVLLEREALTTESFGCAAGVLPTLNEFKPANKAFCSTTTPAVLTVAPPTTTSSPTMGERCGSCGQLPFGLGACRCHSFESVRKRQRRLSLFVRTGTLGVESCTGGGELSSSFGSAVEQARLQLVLDDDDANATINSTTGRVTINQSMAQVQRQGDDSEDEREEELAQESENSEEDEEDEAELINNRAKGTSSIRRGDTKYLRAATQAQRRLSVSHFFCSDAPSPFPSASSHHVSNV
jgi:hypothetical protein